MNKKASILSKFLALYFSFFMVFWCGPVLALPQNGSVIAGAANIGNSSANFLEINQQTQRAIIDWSSFSIANGETTVFNQPGISAATLNRVTGGNLSEIFGHLKANGSLYLINPNGILIGSTGVIDVNTFIASTLNINNNAFMSGGDMIFSGNSNASIQNFGTINAMEGDVFLISRKIENAGTINAPQGAVGLAAGEPADGENLEVLLKASGGQRIFIRTKKEKKVATETTTDETVTTTKEVDDSTLTLTETEKNATEVPDATDTQITDLNTEKTNTESAEIETTQNVVNIKDFAAGAEPEFTYEYEYVWEPVTLNLNVGEIETDSNATDTTTEALTTENTSSDLSEDSTTISAEDASIINTGIINAVQAELKTYGGNEYALAINNEGEIRATGVENRNGVVYLTAENGDVNNSGLISSQNSNGDGGRVSLQAVNGSTTSSGIIDVSSTTDTGVGGYAEVLGNKVEITGNTLVNASGNAGGGEILIGGDYQGKNENIQNASETLISA
jgi:filamentous hemagglutinin family protein